MDISEKTDNLEVSVSRDSNGLNGDRKSDLDSSNRLHLPDISIVPEIHTTARNTNGNGIGAQNEMQGNCNLPTTNGKMVSKSHNSRLKSQTDKLDSASPPQIKDKGLLKSPWVKSNTIRNNDVDESNKNKKQLTDQSYSNTTPWDRILQCFSVFKHRKASTDSASNLNTPSLKKNMTESDFFLYDLSTKSEILNVQDTKNLGTHLPPRAIGYPWELTFSTSVDGFSLHQMYRKMDKIDSPVLLVIEDIDNRVFGAIVSCAFRVSENFYGSSDTFLFRARPNFEVFKWSGDNFYFIQGQDDFISIGSDGGKFGLWLDDNLYIGRTEECSTFASPPLVEEKDFKMKTVECWTVGTI